MKTRNGVTLWWHAVVILTRMDAASLDMNYTLCTNLCTGSPNTLIQKIYVSEEISDEMVGITVRDKSRNESIQGIPYHDSNIPPQDGAVLGHFQRRSAILVYFKVRKAASVHLGTQNEIRRRIFFYSCYTICPNALWNELGERKD